MAPPKKRRQKLRRNTSLDSKEKEQATVRLVNSLLDAETVNLAQLRKVAAVRGLANNEVRARAWPVLLGVELGPLAALEYESFRYGKHRDTAVVECDVQRSLWSYTEGWPEEERAAKRGELAGVLTAAVVAGGGGAHYYQGLHDIAAVLLFVAGPAPAYAMLRHLLACQLRDCTRATLDAALEVLGLLLPIVGALDPELAGHIESSGVQPYFALAWLLTWFTHGLPGLMPAARLFDLFLASHPLMPLYAAAVAMQAARGAILACEADAAELHRLLTNLPVLRAASADQIAQRAVAAFRHWPPRDLERRHRLKFLNAASLEASLVGGHWQVPDKPSMKPGQAVLGAFTGFMFRAGKRRRWAATLTTVASVTSLAALTAALYLAQHDAAHCWQYTLF